MAFHALRFSAPIREMGNRLAERMWQQGPYIALHLRMEKDVWVRTGCLPGLSREHDEMITQERISRPELLTGRSNMTYQERKLAGLCPLNALEVARCIFHALSFIHRDSFELENFRALLEMEIHQVQLVTLVNLQSLLFL